MTRPGKSSTDTLSRPRHVVPPPGYKINIRNPSESIILVDTQDNPGCGGSSDSTGLLHEMLKQTLENAAIAMFYDPEVAQAAYSAGKGSELTLSLGAKIESAQTPVVGQFKVINVSEGRFKATGPFYRNALMDIGPTAWLNLQGIDILVSSRKVQAADQSLFRHLGLEPATKRILALKSSVHYRADFDSIASKQLIVETPGANVANLKRLTYHHLRPGVACL